MLSDPFLIHLDTGVRYLSVPDVQDSLYPQHGAHVGLRALVACALSMQGMQIYSLDCCQPCQGMQLYSAACYLVLPPIPLPTALVAHALLQRVLPQCGGLRHCFQGSCCYWSCWS